MTLRPFRDLSRRARLVRFRELAKIALQAYGLQGAQLTFLQYGENVIYRVDLPGRSPRADQNSPFHPNRCLLRLHAWDNLPYINSEMIWLDALVHQAGIIVPDPIRTLDGEFVVKVASHEVPQGRCVTLLGWLDGRKMEKGIRAKHLKALGRLMAQLHNFSATWQIPEGFSRPTWDWEAQLGGSLFNVNLEELVRTITQRFQEPFEVVSRQAKQAMAELGTGSDAFGLIHADIYPENILFKAGQPYLIDFEDCGFGHWIWDIAVALCTWAWKENWGVMRDAFYNGYVEVRPLPDDQWGMLDLFIATQYATMLLWASAFLKSDPKRVDEYVPWRDDSGNRLLKYFSLSK